VLRCHYLPRNRIIVTVFAQQIASLLSAHSCSNICPKEFDVHPARQTCIIYNAPHFALLLEGFY
jgi:hypothetical protein